jgi:hypothetical protein
LFVPHGAALNPGAKNRDGLFVDAVVLVEHSGYGALDSHGAEAPMTCLVTRVYPDDEPAADRDGATKPWSGDRPFIDAIGVMTLVRDTIVGLGEIVILRKVPYLRDVQREARLMGVPVQAVRWPGYRIVTKLEGIR